MERFNCLCNEQLGQLLDIAEQLPQLFQTQCDSWPSKQLMPGGSLAARHLRAASVKPTC